MRFPSWSVMLPYLPIRDVTGTGHTAKWSVAMTDAGLVCGAGTMLARMASKPDMPPRLSLETDKDRLLAMLSLVAGQPVSAAKVLHHVEAAEAHWQRGDKALANLRLIFARLPRPSDSAAVDRLSLSEKLLDDGLTPGGLMKALWPQPPQDEFRRYNPDQRRVPAGHGVESGRWEFEGAGEGRANRGEGSPIIVAANVWDKNKGKSPEEILEDEKLFQEREMLGAGTPEEELAHGRAIDPFQGLPSGAEPARRAVVEGTARAALNAVEPGKGPVYGTRIHTEMKGRINALGDPNLSAEQSYLNGKRVDYGTKGSVRYDAVEGDPDMPSAGYDLKTGSAKLTAPRANEMRSHLPKVSRGMPIIEIKP